MFLSRLGAPRKLIELHQGSLGGFRRLPVARSHILHGRSDRAMPESLTNERQIHVASNEMRRQRVLEAMGMALLSRQPNGLRAGLKHPKKLAALKTAAFLTGEQEIRTVSRTFAEPGPQRVHFIQLVAGHGVGRAAGLGCRAKNEQALFLLDWRIKAAHGGRAMAA
jgi:hypothetical protein